MPTSRRSPTKRRANPVRGASPPGPALLASASAKGYGDTWRERRSPGSLATARSRTTCTALAQVREVIISCDRCARLRTYCQRVATEKKAAHRHETYWGRPVPGFGDPHARVLVIGLAPAAHGANRTGRVFTGDGPLGSGDFLMRAMHAHGFASIPTARHADDGLTLTDAFIAAAVRCAPPDNTPTPAEIAACHRHLVAEVAALPRVEVIIGLGRIGFDAAWRLLADRGIVVRPRPPFGHDVAYEASGFTVIGSYHPSRQNTNTGKLTPPMMDAVFARARGLVGGKTQGSGLKAQARSSSKRSKVLLEP